MIDGVYQSIMVFFIPYLLFMPGTFLTGNGLGVEDRLRFGAYVAHPRRHHDQHVHSDQYLSLGLVDGAHCCHL